MTDAVVVVRVWSFGLRSAHTAHMSKSTVSRQVVWAGKKRAHLMQVLGAKCAHCGTTGGLTFDCIRPTGPAHHRLSSVNRMTFYVQQFRAGNLQVLCVTCNSRKSNKENPRYVSAASRQHVSLTGSNCAHPDNAMPCSHTHKAPVVASTVASLAALPAADERECQNKQTSESPVSHE